MITKSRFCKIKRGDVVLWNGKPRYVLRGPADDSATTKSHSSRLYVQFPIRRRSWTNRATTLYGWSACKNSLTIPRRRLLPQGICVSEKSQLASIGFDWLEELEREVALHEAYIERLENGRFSDHNHAARLRRDKSYRAAKAQLKRNSKRK